jgi:hypothetical protein
MVQAKVMESETATGMALAGDVVKDSIREMTMVTEEISQFLLETAFPIPNAGIAPDPSIRKKREK